METTRPAHRPCVTHPPRRACLAQYARRKPLAVARRRCRCQSRELLRGVARAKIGSEKENVQVQGSLVVNAIPSDYSPGPRTPTNGEVPVFVVEVQPVADHEFIRNREANKVRLERHFLPTDFSATAQRLSLTPHRGR